jgi:hypothetical protein
MSSEIFPEKFAMYFSSMNSLSAKIYSDIEGVESEVRFSAKNLSYNERCAVLDKALIHDLTVRKRGEEAEGGTILSEDDEEEKLENKELFRPVHFNDPCLDQLQTTSLLLSVYPKKPEKYIFEENGFWVDEHSAPFSYCKQSQTNYCHLGELVKKLPLDSLQSLIGLEGKEEQITRDQNKNAARESSRKLTRKLSRDDILSDDSSVGGSCRKKEVKKKAKAPTFFGVNVMGGVSGGSQQEQIRREPEPEEPSKTEAEEADDEESKLPKQKQNLELIAELQAKLNRNKTNRAVEVTQSQPEKEQHSSSLKVQVIASGNNLTNNKVNIFLY